MTTTTSAPASTLDDAPRLAQPPVLRLRDAPEVLAYLPHRLGFRPRDSLVVAGVGGPGRRLGLVARVDLTDLTGPAGPLLAHDLVTHLLADGADEVIVAAHTATDPRETLPDGRLRPDPGSETVRAVERFALAWEARRPRARSELWVVVEGGYLDLDCSDAACCPVGGRPLRDLEDSAAGRRLAATGSVVAPDRAALARIDRAGPGPRRSADSARLRWSDRLRRARRAGPPPGVGAGAGAGVGADSAGRETSAVPRDAAGSSRVPAGAGEHGQVPGVAVAARPGVGGAGAGSGRAPDRAPGGAPDRVSITVPVGGSAREPAGDSASRACDDGMAEAQVTPWQAEAVRRWRSDSLDLWTAAVAASLSADPRDDREEGVDRGLGTDTRAGRATGPTAHAQGGPSAGVTGASDTDERGRGAGERGVGARGTDADGADGCGVGAHDVEGRGVDGRGADGRGADGRGADGRGADGQRSGGQSAGGHRADGQRADGHGSDGHRAEGDDVGPADLDRRTLGESAVHGSGAAAPDTRARVVRGPAPRMLGRIEAALADPVLRDAVLLAIVDPVSDLPRQVIREGDDGRWADGEPVGPRIGAALDGLLVPGRASRPDPAVVAAAVVVLEQVVAHGRVGRQAPALTLLALVAWWSGDGPRASVLVERALHDDPEHTLGALVDRLVRSGAPPAWLQDLR